MGAAWAPVFGLPGRRRRFSGPSGRRSKGVRPRTDRHFDEDEPKGRFCVPGAPRPQGAGVPQGGHWKLGKVRFAGRQHGRAIGHRGPDWTYWRRAGGRALDERPKSSALTGSALIIVRSMDSKGRSAPCRYKEGAFQIHRIKGLGRAGVPVCRGARGGEEGRRTRRTLSFAKAPLGTVRRNRPPENDKGRRRDQPAPPFGAIRARARRHTPGTGCGVRVLFQARRNRRRRAKNSAASPARNRATVGASGIGVAPPPELLPGLEPDGGS